MDLYFPAIGLMAFLSGSCIGFYYGVVQRTRQEPARRKPKPYAAGRADRLW